MYLLTTLVVSGGVGRHGAGAGRVRSDGRGGDGHDDGGEAEDGGLHDCDGTDWSVRGLREGFLPRTEVLESKSRRTVDSSEKRREDVAGWLIWLSWNAACIRPRRERAVRHFIKLPSPTSPHRKSVYIYFFALVAGLAVHGRRDGLPVDAYGLRCSPWRRPTDHHCGRGRSHSTGLGSPTGR